MMLRLLRPEGSEPGPHMTGLLAGEKMVALCREFDVSRKTGYMIFARCKDCGLEGLTDRSRRPHRQADSLPIQVESLSRLYCSECGSRIPTLFPSVPRGRRTRG